MCADKFLNTGGGGNANISNGSANIFAATLGADNLEPSKALKTNSVKQLISTNLDIADVNNLRSELDNVLTNPFQGTLQADDFKGDSIKDKTETSTINLTPTEIDLVATSVKVNGQAVDASVDLQDAYNNSVVAETQLATTKPYIIKAVDTAEIVNIDGDTKEVNFTGDVLVNGSNLETQINNVEGDIIDLQNDKYDKTGGILTGQIDMSNNKIINLTTPTDPFDASTKNYVDNAISGIQPVDLTDLETKTQNISLTTTSGQTDIGGVINNTDFTLQKPAVITQLNNGGGSVIKGTSGFSFDVVSPITMTTIKLALADWRDPSNTKQIGLWEDGNSTALYTGILTKTNVVGDYAVENITPTALTQGSRYLIGIRFTGDDSFEPQVNPPSSPEIDIYGFRVNNNAVVPSDAGFSYPAFSPNGNDNRASFGNFDFEISGLGEIRTKKITTPNNDLLIVDASINANDFVKYQGGVDYLNPPDINSLAAVGYVNQEINNIPPTDLTELESKTQNISLAETDATKTTFTQDIELKDNALKFTSGNYTSSLENFLLSISNINNTRTTLSEFELRFNNSTNSTRLIQDPDLFDIDSSAPISFKIDTAEKIKVEPVKTTFKNDIKMENGVSILSSGASIISNETIFQMLNMSPNGEIFIGAENYVAISQGDFLHNGNNCQFNGVGSLQIQNAGAVQIQPTGLLILKDHLSGEINMTNNKIIGLGTPTGPLDGATKKYVDATGWATVCFGGQENNIFNNRHYFELYGSSSSSTDVNLSYDNVLFPPLGGRVRRLSFIKSNQTGTCTIQIVLNGVANEDYKYNITGPGGSIDVDVPFTPSDFINLAFRNDNEVPLLGRYVLYIQYDNESVGLIPTQAVPLSSRTGSQMTASAPLSSGSSVENRLTVLENILNELTN